MGDKVVTDGIAVVQRDQFGVKYEPRPAGGPTATDGPAASHSDMGDAAGNF